MQFAFLALVNEPTLSVPHVSIHTFTETNPSKFRRQTRINFLRLYLKISTFSADDFRLNSKVPVLPVN